MFSRISKLFIVCIMLIVISGVQQVSAVDEPLIGQHAYIFEHTLKEQNAIVHVNYLLFLPLDYGLDEQKKYPLIMFFHGAGQMGDNVEIVKAAGPPKIVEQQADFPFIVLSPQKRKDINLDANSAIKLLTALLDEIVVTYSVDTGRIYLTGLSMGGNDTWFLATSRPELFAAIAPVCGWYDPAKACALKDTPVWVFHGAKDNIIPISYSEEMVEALEACGGNVRFTVYPDADHDAWTVTYNNPELYDWFLQHSLKPVPTSVRLNGKWMTLWSKTKSN